MALHEVEVERLRIGIFVQLDLPWMQHPFLTSHFKVRSEKQLEILRALGLRKVKFDPKRSDCRPLNASEVTEVPPAARSEADLNQVARLAWEEKSQRIEKLKERRARLNQCAKRYSSSVSAARKLFPMMQSMPDQAARQARNLIGDMVSELALDQEATVQLVNLKHLGANSYFHAINTVALALVLGSDLKLDAAELRTLGLGALFHDLGHQQVPARILLKADPWTTAEMNLYRQHPDFGIQIAKRMQTLPTSVVEIIARHHEHLDGSGFPNQLRDQDIGTLTRIITVVNRYDNLCNGFGGRRGLSPHQAISVMYQREKTCYDQRVLTAFISCLGVFPPGTVVRLTDGRIAVVTSVNRDALTKPNVLVYAPEVPKEEAVILDLSEEDLGVTESLHLDVLDHDQVEYLSVSDKLSYYFQQQKKPPRA